jgi:proteic killer suppression protein
MEINFTTRKLEQSLTDANVMLKSYGNRAHKVNQRVKELKAAANLEVMKTIPAANCHLLKGDRSKQFAVDISGNWRIIFEPDNNPIPASKDGSIDCSAVSKITIIKVEDYH